MNFVQAVQLLEREMMTKAQREARKAKRALALAIVSRRKDGESLSNAEYETLGYNPYAFRAFGAPTDEEICQRAQEVLLEAFDEQP